MKYSTKYAPEPSSESDDEAEDTKAERDSKLKQTKKVRKTIHKYMTPTPVPEPSSDSNDDIDEERSGAEGTPPPIYLSFSVSLKARNTPKKRKSTSNGSILELKKEETSYDRTNFIIETLGRNRT